MLGGLDVIISESDSDLEYKETNICYGKRSRRRS
jgi:hypothetical protein